MAYCRWSTDDFQCDVYCYADVKGGWTIHVAGLRNVGPEPRPKTPPLAKDNINAWLDSHRALMAWLEKAERVKIGLPNDGETYNVASPGEAADVLVELREKGYLVPQFAIDALREEQTELDKEEAK